MRQLSFSDYEWSVNRNKKTRSEIQLDKINNIVGWQKVKWYFNIFQNKGFLIVGILA